MQKKSRVLLIKEIIERKSDSDHVLSSRNILDQLSKTECIVDRRTLYRDMNSLIASNVDIVKTGRGYYLNSRSFSAPELRLLYDAVISSACITAEKTNALLSKLGKLTNEYDEQKFLFQQNLPSYKSQNESLYDLINVLQSAIQNQKIIQFSYSKETFQNIDILKYEVSPYRMLWKNGYYYLIANVSRYQTLTHFRIDRIQQIYLTRKNARPLQQITDCHTLIDASEYFKHHVNMSNGGKTEKISLRCANHLYDDVIHTFGRKGIHIQKSGRYMFQVETKTFINKGLIGWIAQFGKDIEVLAPRYLRQRIYRYLVYAAQKYSSVSGSASATHDAQRAKESHSPLPYSFVIQSLDQKTYVP